MNVNEANNLKGSIEASLFWVKKAPNLYRGSDMLSKKSVQLMRKTITKLKKFLATGQFSDELSRFGAKIERFSFPLQFDNFERSFLPGIWQVRYLDNDYCVVAWNTPAMEIVTYVEGDIIWKRCATPAMFERELTDSLRY
ncbi:MAG: hypothetical protein LRY40_03660 [Shewanella fodinae]|nr:hypothetical protein [Shewanella fodinae]